MKSIDLFRKDKEAFPDKSFVSCLYCIPRSWTLFANDKWCRVFESKEGQLRLVREFKRQGHLRDAEPVTFEDKISLWLDEAVWRDEFDHLILAAPEPLLDKMNKALSLAVLARTIAEIDWPDIAQTKNTRKDRIFPLSAFPGVPLKKMIENRPVAERE